MKKRRNRNSDEPPQPGSGMPESTFRVSDAVLVAALAIAVRVAYAISYWSSPLFGSLRADQRLYWDWAVAIAQGNWLSQEVFRQGPLYPYLLGSLQVITGPTMWPALWLQMIAGSGTSLLVYDCARRLFDRSTALTAGLISATYGPFVFYECMILKSCLTPLLTVLALWCALLYGERASPRWLALSGASVGLACLVRENYALLFIPLVWWCWYLKRKRLVEASTRWIRHAAVLLASGAAVIAPATVHNMLVGGEFVAVTSGGGEVLYLAHGPFASGYYTAPPFVRADPRFEHEDFRREASRRAGRPLSPAESSRFWFVEALREIASHPVRAVSLTVEKTMVLLSDYEVPDGEDYQVAQELMPLLKWLPSFGTICGLGILGISIGSWRRAELWLLFGMLLCQALSIVLLFNFGRFRLGLVPLWILFASHALVWLVRGVRGLQPVAGWRLIAAALLLLLVSASSYSAPMGFDETDYLANGQRALEAFRHRADHMRQAAQLRPLAQSETGVEIEARMELASLLTQIGDWDGAEHIYSEVLKDVPNSESARARWVALKLQRGHIRQGIALYESGGADLRQADANYNLGAMLEGQGWLDRALNYYDRAIAISPQYADAWYNSGVVLGRLNRSEQAMERYENVLRLEPEHADAHNNLGSLLVRQGQLTEAASHFEAAIKSQPTHKFAKHNLAAVRAAMALD